MARALTPETLVAATVPTFYFIGVTTGSSSIRTVFPRWAEALALGPPGPDPVELVGIDVAIHAPAAHYRAVVDFIAADPLSFGALVTTHKIDLYEAAADRFDEIDPLATLMSEVSCLSKRGGVFRASAKDPYSAGLALEAFVPESDWEGAEWAGAGRELFVMGAGGSAIAIDWYLSRPDRGAARPARVTVTDRSADRLAALRRVHAQAAAEVPLRTEVVDGPADNDAVLAVLAAGAVVVNATGLGKDAHGSPLSDAAVFPERGAAWDLNYRGDLVFLDQARAQQPDRSLTVEDGWTYFVHGWTQVIADVFDVQIPTSGPRFDELSALAAASRG